MSTDNDSQTKDIDYISDAYSYSPWKRSILSSVLILALIWGFSQTILSSYLPSEIYVLGEFPKGLLNIYSFAYFAISLAVAASISVTLWYTYYSPASSTEFINQKVTTGFVSAFAFSLFYSIASLVVSTIVLCTISLILLLLFGLGALIYYIWSIITGIMLFIGLVALLFRKRADILIVGIALLLLGAVGNALLGLIFPEDVLLQLETIVVDLTIPQRTLNWLTSTDSISSAVNPILAGAYIFSTVSVLFPYNYVRGLDDYRDFLDEVVPLLESVQSRTEKLNDLAPHDYQFTMDSSDYTLSQFSSLDSANIQLTKASKKLDAYERHVKTYKKVVHRSGENKPKFLELAIAATHPDHCRSPQIAEEASMILEDIAENYNKYENIGINDNAISGLKLGAVISNLNSMESISDSDLNSLEEASEDFQILIDLTCEIDIKMLEQYGFTFPLNKSDMAGQYIDQQNSSNNTGAGPIEVSRYVEYFEQIGKLSNEIHQSRSDDNIPDEFVKTIGQILTLADPIQIKDSVTVCNKIYSRSIRVLEIYFENKHLIADELQSDITESVNNMRTKLSSGENVTERDLFTVSSNLNKIRQRTEKSVYKERLERRLKSLEVEWQSQPQSTLGLNLSEIIKVEINPKWDNWKPSEVEDRIEYGEGLLEVANRVSQLNNNHDSASKDLKSELANSISSYIESQGVYSRSILIDPPVMLNAISVTEKATELNEVYNDYRFSKLVGYILNEIENGTLSSKKVNRADKVLEDSAEIVEFIEDNNVTNLTISEADMRESVHHALESNSNEPLKDRIKTIEDIGDSLWEGRHLSEYGWEEFEHLVGDLFKSEGYSTSVTQKSADMGVDVWANKDGNRTAIQVKKFSKQNTVGREPLQKVASAIAKGDADKVVVVTSSSFADTAEQYADDFGSNMQLVDRAELLRRLNKSNVVPPE